MKFSIKNILKYAAVGAILASGACSDDFMVSDEADNSSMSEGLTFMCGDMLEVFTGLNNEATRAGGSKTEDEKKIKTLHVFFFNGGGDGELLKPNYTNFSSYQKINVEEEKGIERYLLKLSDGEWNSNKGLFSDKNGNPKKSNIRVVAIANIDALEGVVPESDDNRFYTQLPDGTVQTNGKIQKAGRSFNEEFPITKYSDLQEWVYYPKIRMNEDGTAGDISKLPEAGMPMIGEQIIDLTDKSAIVINMKALMAKVNVAIKLDPDQYTDNLPALTITEYGVLNMPIAVPFKQPEGKPVNGWEKTENLDAYFKAYDVTKQPMFHKNGTPSGWNDDHAYCDPANHEFTNVLKNPVRIIKGADPVLLCSYYTFENINMPDYSAKRATVDGLTKEAFTGDGGSTEYEPNYPDGVAPEDYQRWKPTIAYKDRASAMILKGEYTTHQGLKYNAQFTIYLGMDTDTDFKVKRNHKYDNNIVIKGLDYVRNAVDDVYTFDGRVNVVTDNPLYLAIVNERKVDVHATALPMDVWLLNYEDFTPEPEDYYTDVTFTIPEVAQDWIQMVMIPRSEMQHEDGRFYAGSGIEKYFYKNLLKDIKERPNTVLSGGENGAYAGHNKGAQCGSEVTVSCTPTEGGNNSRSRVYFYIDENTTDWQYDDGKCMGTPDRTVEVQVKYKSYRLNGTDTVKESVTEKFRTIEIEQRGLLRVKNRWYSWHTESPYYDANGEEIDETFIEYYEEYLNHTDPLDEHVSGDVYEGLEWGLDGYSFPTKIDGMGDTNPIDAMKAKQGSLVTNWIINHTKDLEGGSMKDVRLFDRKKKPYSALHYCYGKNKRNYDGTVDVEGSTSTGYYGWYMPGIKELETALVEYYEKFEDFQNKLYWSCAPNKSTHHARATKVLVTADRIEYVDSDQDKPENPQFGGYQLRTAKLRIRAFYRRKS
ncbi:MAG: hypothetical protein K2N48_12430 [Muribaculaceae bacterium]|nr:hypothetical protein [Muribaculaceae bacterium]